MPMGAAAPPCAFEPHEEVMWKLPSGVTPGPLPESGLIPQIVRVRLPVRDPEQGRAQFISAVVQAASGNWYRPTDAPGVRERRHHRTAPAHHRTYVQLPEPDDNDMMSRHSGRCLADSALGKPPVQ